MRHCCVVPCIVCNWHRYVFLMACAPHLSYLAMVFSLGMVWIVQPKVGCGEVFVGVCCVGCGWFPWDGGGGGDRGRNSDLASCSAFLMILDACLYVVWNSYGDNTALVCFFWICGSIVITYVYSLSRYFRHFFALSLRWRMLGWIAMLALVRYF